MNFKRDTKSSFGIHKIRTYHQNEKLCAATFFPKSVNFMWNTVSMYGAVILHFSSKLGLYLRDFKLKFLN